MAIGQISSVGSVPIPVSAVPPSPASGSPVGQILVGTSATDTTPVVQPGQSNTTTTSGSGNTQQTLKQSVSTINAYLNSMGNNNIEFSINQSTGQVVVQVVDTQTQTVLMQTPSKEALALAQALDGTHGLLIRTQA